MLKTILRWCLPVCGLGLLGFVMVVGGNQPAGTPALAQDDAATCPAIVQEAISQTQIACAATGRNEACYGHQSIQAQAKPEASNFSFDDVGDIAALLDVQALRLSPLDTVLDVWGLARLEVQASLPDGAAENVTLILFGDVEIEDTAGGDTPPMSAFTFQSGRDDAPCAAAPESGILVQTPEGVGRVRMLVNEVVINLGSTAFLQSQPGGTFSVTMLEGEGELSTDDGNLQIGSGEQGTVPMGNNNTPSGPPAPGADPAQDNNQGLQNVSQLLPENPFAPTEDEDDDTQDDPPQGTGGGGFGGGGANDPFAGLAPASDPPPDAPAPGAPGEASGPMIMRVPSPIPPPALVAPAAGPAPSVTITSCIFSSPNLISFSYANLPANTSEVFFEPDSIGIICGGFASPGISSSGVASICAFTPSTYTFTIYVKDISANILFSTTQAGVNCS